MTETKNIEIFLLMFVFSVMSLNSSAEMAHQNLDDAAYIFLGNVAKVEKLPNEGDFESKYHDAYIVHVFVHDVKRGDLTAGETFGVRIFDNRRRFEQNLNDGWVGPAGHKGMPDEGQMINVYAHEDHRGVYPIWYIVP